jgi:hypothetical protein
MMISRSQISECPWTYQANTRSKCTRKRQEDTYRWIKPFCPSFIGIPGLIQPLELLLKDGKNVARRVAGLELGGKWM